MSMKKYFLSAGKATLIAMLGVWAGMANEVNAHPTVVRNTLAVEIGEVDRAIASLPANRERQLAAEINWARTQPAAYADWLETLRPYYNGMILSLPGAGRIRTYEGIAALEEAIALLRSQSPLLPLRLSTGMSQGARDGVTNLESGAEGVGDRISRYGSWSGSALELISSSQQSAAMTVAAWLINDGDRNRPMRTTLLSSQLEFFGIGCGDRPDSTQLCAINYATAYTEQNGSTASLSETPTVRQSMTLEGAPTAIVPPAVSIAAEAGLASDPMPAPLIPSKRSSEPELAEPSHHPAIAPIVTPDVVDPLQPTLQVPTPMLMAAIAQTNYFSTLADAEFLDGQELELIAEANRLRDNPVAYAAELENLVQYFDGHLLRLPGLPPLETIEGVPAIEEAVAALRQLSSLPPLQLSNGLSLAAADHARDLGTAGRGGHTGHDGSTPFERISRYGIWNATSGSTAGENISFSPWVSAYWHILQWVIDDGVSNRGHREALLRSRYQFTGTACHQHAVYGNVCVMTYASDYTEGD